MSSWRMTPISIPLFPLSTVLFPGGLLPLQIFEVRYLDLINKCIADGTGFGVVSLTQGSEVRKPDVHETFAAVGTTAKVIEWQAPLPGLLRITCAGESRFRIAASEQLKHGLWMATVEPIADDLPVEVPAELRNTASALEKLIASLQADGVADAEMPVRPPYRFDDCGWVANRWCELLPAPATQKQRLLELDNPLVRLELVQDLLAERGLLDQGSSMR
ncbi:MAG: peptidase [Noviherbaspirillum sp.]|nr:peptidase [Noviherbaspirillum sp.]